MEEVMLKSSKKFVGILMVLTMLSSYFTPIVALAETNIPQQNTIGEEETQVLEQEELQNNGSEVLELEEHIEFIEQIQEVIDNDQAEELPEKESVIIINDEFDLYIKDEEGFVTLDESETENLINQEIELTHKIQLESVVFLQFKLNEDQIAWINAEDVEILTEDTEVIGNSVNTDGDSSEQEVEIEVNDETSQESEEKDVVEQNEVVEAEELSEQELIEEQEVIEEQTEQVPSIQSRMQMFTTSSVNTTPQIQYRAHVEKQGWLPWVEDRVMSGTLGQGLRMEAFQLKVNSGNVGIRYSTRSEDGDWTGWTTGGTTGGTTDQKRHLEGVRIELTGQDASKYDIYYRVHTESFGWMPWTKNGEKAGTEGYNYRVESMQVSILPKGDTSISTSTGAYRYVASPKITYRAHVQTEGWLSWVGDRGISGTSDKGLRMEAFQLNVTEGNVGVRYQTRSENGSWTEWSNNGQIGGTTDQKRQLEGVRFELTGQDASNYDIYYRVHTEKFGWLPWAKNGTQAGTEGYGYRIESMQVSVLPKSSTTISVGESYRIPSEPSITYQTHVEKIGWQSWVEDGELAGTSGQALRLEAIRLNLSNAALSGGIEYRTHIQSSGWSGFTSQGSQSGSVGSKKRLEAIEIRLTGEISNQYDVYYRTHVQSEGWLGWVKNGMASGSEGLAYRLEGIQVKLVPKGQGDPVNADNGLLRKPLIYLDSGHGGSESGAVSGGVFEKTINLQTAKRIESLLLGMGYRVHMSRTTDKQLSLSARAQEANRMNADIFVSVHYNAFRGTSQGIETYYYNQSGNTSNPYANNSSRISKSRSLATDIHNNVLSTSGAVDRNVRSANFHVIRETYMPAVLLELGYMDNASERAKITTPSYQQKLAQGVANGINQYFK